MNKFQFIKQLLDTKKFTPSQKERFFKLVSMELADIGNHNHEILKDIRLIKERLGLEDNPAKEEQSVNYPPDGSDDNLKNLPKYHFPVSLYKFLFNYNQNKILKSTCHDIDSDELETINKYCNTDKYNFNRHLNKIIEAYEIHENNHFAPSSLKTLFRVYLTGENYRGEPIEEWTSDRIKINWSSNDLKIWSSGNENVPPNPSDGVIEQFENTGYEFPAIESKLTGQNIQSFSQLVIHFKHLFHFRSDNSLRSIIERKNTIEGWNDKINFIIDDVIFPSNVEHFTDIDKLVQAYKKIILIILEVVEIYSLEKPQIRLSIGVNLEQFYFSIHHINSTYKKTLPNIIERLGQNYRNLILNQINGLCEFYLRADFGQNIYSQINLWNGKVRSSSPIEDKDFKGVEHLFIFPKK